MGYVKDLILTDQEYPVLCEQDFDKIEQERKEVEKEQEFDDLPSIWQLGY